MNGVPTISVLMPVYNCEPYLDEAIRSIRGQTFADFEFVIVNDGSTDGSLDTIRRHAAEDPRIVMLDRPNGGIVDALNAGLETCRGEFIARMDGDDVALQERFDVQIKFLDSNPGVVAVGTQFQMIDYQGCPLSKSSFPTEPDLVLDHLIRFAGVGLQHPTVMVRHDAIKAAGGYRQQYEYAEDTDLFYRLANYGGLANVSRCLLLYRQHSESICSKSRLGVLRAAYWTLLEHRELIKHSPQRLLAAYANNAAHHLAARGFYAAALRYSAAAFWHRPFNRRSISTAGRVFLKSLTRASSQPSTSPTTEGDTIHVAFAVDSKMVQPFAVALASIRKNSPPQRKLHVRVLDVGLTQAERSRVLQSMHGAGHIKLTFIDGIATRLSGYPRVGHLSQAAYARLLLPELLADTDRVIYLDCDLIACGPLDELWETPLHGKSLGAAHDPSYDRIGDPGAVGYADDLADPNAKYFNSGVMVIDLGKWRSTDVTGQTLQFIQRYGDQLNLADQDALNAICGNDYIQLNDEWNALVRVAGKWRRWRQSEAEHGKAPVARILHFASALKPWNSGPRHPYAWLYTKKLMSSGWMRLHEWPRYCMSSWLPSFLRRRFRE